MRTLVVAIGIACAAGALAAEVPVPPAMLLAREIAGQVDASRYLVSEKYDGVRAQWDGRRLVFRGGGEVHAPAWFIARLPKEALDGELWLGRGRFEALSGVVRKEVPVDDEWRQVKFMVFELPGGVGSFAERVARIESIVAAAKWPQLVAVPQWRIADKAALQKKLDEVVAGGGEGLMLHRADASYETGRSDVLLKLKPLQDAEAEVIGIVPGKGRLQGRMGALKVRTPEGKVFAIGTGFSDELRAAPPAIGATITYTYRGFTTNGLPRFASYLRLRDAP